MGRAQRGVAVPDLVQRACTCTARICFQQFQGCEEEIVSARDAFRRLDTAGRALCFLLNTCFYLGGLAIKGSCVSSKIE